MHCPTGAVAANADGPKSHPDDKEGSRIQSTLGSLATVKIDAELKRRLCPAKYPEKFAGKYRQKDRELCICLRHDVCSDLNPALYLDLNPDLNPELLRPLLA